MCCPVGCIRVVGCACFSDEGYVCELAQKSANLSFFGLHVVLNMSQGCLGDIIRLNNVLSE